jgi:ethanolamine ammonia-lyase small subunit
MGRGGNRRIPVILVVAPSTLYISRSTYRRLDYVAAGEVMNEPDSSVPPEPELIPQTVSGLVPFSDAWLAAVRQQTPARIFQGRAGSGYRTTTQLELRRDHAAALDAVHADLDPVRDWGLEFVERWNLFEVQTQATSKSHYLMRPDLGRRLSQEANEQIVQSCRCGADLQIVVGDGLSAAAVIKQVPRLLPLLIEGAKTRGWSTGQPFLIRYCRVGVLNDIGELLNPRVVLLLIGERPGLATAESLSAYFAHRPRQGQTDAHRNLISNIHDRGLPPEVAICRILDLAQQMMDLGQGGVQVKENLTRRLPS